MVRKKTLYSILNTLLAPVLKNFNMFPVGNRKKTETRHTIKSVHPIFSLGVKRHFYRAKQPDKL